MHPGLEHVALAVVPSASGLSLLATALGPGCGRCAWRGGGGGRSVLALARHAPGLSALGLRRLPATDVAHVPSLRLPPPRAARPRAPPRRHRRRLAAFARHARGALADLASPPAARRAAAAAPLLRRSPRLARLRILDAPISPPPTPRRSLRRWRRGRRRCGS
eukprot:tig00001501_g9226.t1